ncbi:MAG: sigma-70 family RNA polymerase sigma factor [Bacilli bacterium]
MNYKSYNDFELLYLIRENNEDAVNILYSKYYPVVELKAKQYLNSSVSKGLDLNDLIQEGMIGLSQAIKDFKDKKDVKFSTFASLCIEREIQTAVTKADRQKHKVLNDSLSLDYVFDDSERPLLDFIVSENNINPESYLLDLESEKEINEQVQSSLTDFEKEVFKLKINNFSYKEIAEILDKPSKSIDNALQRIKNKVSNIIKNKN